jgi:hypothetical protein
MPEPLLIQRERESLRELIAKAAERSRAEVAVAATYTERMKAFEAESAAERTRIDQQFATGKANAEAEVQQARRSIQQQHETDQAAALAEFDKAKKRAVSVCNIDKGSIQKEVESAKWEAGAVFDTSQSGAAGQLREAQETLATAGESIATLRADATAFLKASHLAGIQKQAAAPTVDVGGVEDPLAALKDRITAADERLGELERLPLPKLLRGGGIAGLFVLIALVVAGPAIFALGLTTGGIVGGVGTVLLGAGALVGIHAVAKKAVSARWPAINEALAHADALIPSAREWATASDQQRRAAIKERREADVRKAEAAGAKRVEDAEKLRNDTVQKADQNCKRRIAEIERRREEQTAQAEATFTRRSQEIQQTFEKDSRAWSEKDKATRDAIHTEHERGWNAMANRWRAAMEKLTGEVKAVQEECGRHFPEWEAASADTWVPPTAPAPVVRFGEFEVELARISSGIPRDDRLKGIGPARFTLPALLPIPQTGSLLIRSGGQGRTTAVELVQAVMLRMLTATPPSKVRFTIIDPVGLGQNFAGFMHLADFDEALVTNRIWTESGHIEQRLADLTEHMEKVIQKYLRNEFASIQEYNDNAGEVAEPFRVLVVANFPVNFSEMAARRLISIAQSGPRCGVYILVTVDDSLQLPSGIALADLEAHATRLFWREGKFVWRDPDFGTYPLKLDTPPSDSALTPIMHTVGQKARDASRVEVPFEIVAPPEDRWWTEDSRSGIDVPLGRVGANKLQYMRLGHGTSQHVLIAGRTGSGKSSLLHALITNVALRYSPDEVELYLIDFKKGVEFKTYAAHRLPHARVVAIESEREFGLSVLQRLDEELRRRGDKFRALNVQDLAGYRESNGKEPLPRILLIVDEFQEFFVEDDKLAQECALLLDRLVRQGRAFGIHIQLGSQTLGGAFSLARSTLGQMAVRIALQCSESDAHLILSEDNSAARLLSRPGEAIYNDANGMLEGNHFFQIVWLGDERREGYLKRIHELAARRDGAMRPQIVFEGNVPADLDKNYLLDGLLRASDWPASTKAAQAWLGDAVAIKDPTAAVFRRQSGANMLIIGQNDDAARGIFLSTIASFTAQYPAERARLYVLDGTVEDSPRAGIFTRLTDYLPHALRVGDWRQTGAVITEVCEEVERRQAAAATDEPAIYLFIFDLARFRDLRKAEDDFSFSRRGEEKANPAKQFSTILREGPGFGVHTILWCDNLNNLNRALDRQTLREFEMRILFQMSPNDSSTLIDSPMAGRLGQHRAFFSSEEQGRLEKFRPYGFPSDEWWTWVREQLQGRSAAAAAKG